MKRSKNIETTLLGKVSEELATVGRGEASQSNWPALSGASIDVRLAEMQYATKTNTLTTSSPSSPLASALKAGTISSVGFLLESTDGKFSAQPVTNEKQQKRMPSEKKEDQLHEVGLKYDTGKPPLDLLSTVALLETAKVMDFGKRKYNAHNWRNGLEWSRVLGAALRHLTAFNAGEDLDPETGLSHLAHASCCVMFLLEYQVTHKELDDRYKEPK